MSTQVIASPAAAEPPGRRGARVCVSKVMVPRRRRGAAHFGSRHPLAQVAQTRCEQTHPVPVSARLGKVACGQCWELVIRTDERIATEHELPPLTGDDASIVDQIAIELAVHGKRVPLTRLEKAEAVAQLAAAGQPAAAVAARLRMTLPEVVELWPAPVEAGGHVATATTQRADQQVT